MKSGQIKLWKWAALLVLLVPYISYVRFIIRVDRGPVDYETFMSIGQRLLSGQEVWGENSFYPMPYVMIFALFRWLPRPWSMAIWHLGPVLAALVISGWSPWVLAFAPVFGHMAGGQTAVFAMLGLWGYRRNLACSGSGQRPGPPRPAPAADAGRWCRLIQEPGHTDDWL